MISLTHPQMLFKQSPYFLSLIHISEVTDFVTKEIPLQHTSLTTERVGGRLMYKALIWQILAYPQRSGELVIPSFEYDFQVSVNRKVDNEEDLFANKAVATAHKKLHSQPLKLTVRPPVSYTHLDVYKRQTLRRSPLASRCSHEWSRSAAQPLS